MSMAYLVFANTRQLGGGGRSRWRLFSVVVDIVGEAGG